MGATSVDSDWRRMRPVTQGSKLLSVGKVGLTDPRLAVPATGRDAGTSLRWPGNANEQRCASLGAPCSISELDGAPCRVPVNAPDAPVSVPVTARRSVPDPTQLAARPRSRGGCRLRSHGGSQWRDGFPDPLGVSMGCGLHWFSGHLSDEHGPGHQIECGIFQYWDLGGRHMAPKHHFGARGQCLGRHGQQLSGVEPGRHRKLPQTH